MLFVALEPLSDAYTNPLGFAFERLIDRIRVDFHLCDKFTLTVSRTEGFGEVVTQETYAFDTGSKVVVLIQRRLQRHWHSIAKTPCLVTSNKCRAATVQLFVATPSVGRCSV